MVLEDPGDDTMAEAAAIRAATDRLTADFTEVWHSTIRGTPLANKALKVEAVGFRRHEAALLGVLVTPWFMNLILMTEDGGWTGLIPGTRETVTVPSGDYDFLHNTRDLTGGYKACSLFSPMTQFTRHQDATDVARAVMAALFDAGNRAETDRSADIRALREAELAGDAAGDAAPIPEAPTRRTLITGGLATGAEAG